MVRNSLSNFIIFTVANLCALCLIESPRCGSAIQSVGPSESRLDTATMISGVLALGRLWMGHQMQSATN